MTAFELVVGVMRVWLCIAMVIVSVVVITDYFKNNI